VQPLGECYELEIREYGADSSKSHESLLDQQVTPIMSSNRIAYRLEPSKFWDMSTHCNVLPHQDMMMPALNGLTEVSEVRDLIRHGLETVTDPTAEDVECLEKYFTELITQKWMEQAAALLRFLNRYSFYKLKGLSHPIVSVLTNIYWDICCDINRQYEQLDDNSPWTPLLAQILDEAQNTWRTLYHGELQLDDEYQ